MANRPTPTKLRELSGSNLNRINKSEARFRSVETAKAPKFVEADAEAKAEWDRVVPELVDNGLLTRANLMVFAAYCRAFSSWMEAEADLAARGRILQESVFNRQGEETGTREKNNPSIGDAQRARLEMLRHAIEFGMTPASSAKVAADPKDDRDASFGDFEETEEDKGALRN